ncbi:MAG: MFS transporter [Pseudomonadota bacterium]
MTHSAGTRRVPPLPVWVKAGYGIGQLAEGAKNAAFAALLFFYYTAVLGLAPEKAGFALLIALLFDAITDPLAGYLSDNLRSRFGRRHPFMIAAALPLGVCFYLLFSPPELSENGLYLWLIVFSILTRGAMTLYHVPHLSLGAELSEDIYERSSVVAYRYFSSYVGALCVYGLGFGVYFVSTPEFEDGKFNLAAYGPFALTIASIMVVTILISAVATLGRIPYLPAPTAVMQREQRWYLIPVRLLGEIVAALRNRSFRWLFLGVLIIFTMVGVDGALSLHMNTYFWALDAGQNLLFFLAMPVGVLIGTGFSRTLNERFDKKACIVLGTGGWVVCQILPVVLRLIGWFPENETEALTLTLTGFRFLQGLLVAQSLVSFNALIPDIVDEHELQTGKRQEGIFFAAISFSAKATHGFGTFFAGIALSLIAWPEVAGEASKAVVSATNIRDLGLVFGPAVALFAVLALLCILRMNMNRDRHRDVVAALAERRQQDQLSATVHNGTRPASA